MNEIKDEISGLVIMAASAVVEKEISEQDNAALIDSFLAKA
jgi:F0F1-type ATP synthase membrane subunit b/b'